MPRFQLPVCIFIVILLQFFNIEINFVCKFLFLCILQQLQSTPEEMTDEHKEEVIKNQSLSNKNRDGADIPGM